MASQGLAAFCRDLVNKDQLRRTLSGLYLVFSFGPVKASFAPGPNNFPLPIVVPTGMPRHNRRSGMGDITPRVPVVKPPMRVF